MEIYIENRPWGKFERYVENQKCTVKTLYMKPNSQTSLQYHDKRDEWWKVIKGSVKILVNDHEHTLDEGNSYYIKRGLKHRITSLDNAAIILEISIGDFDEDDIVRLKDIYNRV